MRISNLLSQNYTGPGECKAVRIAFLGDSVTHGCFEIYRGITGIQCIYDYENVYHNKLKKMLQLFFPTVPICSINAGVSGSTANNCLERLDREVLSVSPHLTVVCVGLNDVHGGMAGLSAYETALDGIISKLVSEQIETIFMTPNMMNTYVDLRIDPEYADFAEKSAQLQNEGMLDRYMEAARKVCRRYNVPVCDCYNRWKHLNKLGVDTTQLLSNLINHPTREMHGLFATSLLEMILGYK